MPLRATTISTDSYDLSQRFLDAQLLRAAGLALDPGPEYEGRDRAGPADLALATGLGLDPLDGLGLDDLVTEAVA